MSDLPILFDAVVFDLEGTLVAPDPRGGGAALMPGAADALTFLRERGVKLGIASNCAQGYLDAMRSATGLARWIDEARCLDSAHVRTKADMIADLLARFGTRSAVMVGDRSGDRDAAWENGIPHVHLTREEGPDGVEAEATISSLAQLPGLLLARSRWIEDALVRIGALAAAPTDARRAGTDPRRAGTDPRRAGTDPRRAGAVALGVTGAPGAGKTLFARDAARVLAAHGRASEVIALEEFLRAGAEADLASTAFVAAQKPLDLLTQGYDLAALEARIARAARGTTVILHGPFLAHPALRSKLDWLVHLDSDEATCLRRLAGRDVRAQGPETLMRVRRQLLPASRAFDAQVPPREHADLVLDARNPLGG